MAFAETRDCVHPPYLLNFMGTPGERYAENLKVGFATMGSRVCFLNNLFVADNTRCWLLYVYQSSGSDLRS